MNIGVDHVLVDLARSPKLHLFIDITWTPRSYDRAQMIKEIMHVQEWLKTRMTGALQEALALALDKEKKEGS